MTSSADCPEGLRDSFNFDFYEVFPNNQVEAKTYTLISTEGECLPNGSEYEAFLGTFNLI
jgi:hypothetical protein